jgi:hypothetical protein
MTFYGLCRGWGGLCFTLERGEVDGSGKELLGLSDFIPLHVFKASSLYIDWVQIIHYTKAGESWLSTKRQGFDVRTLHTRLLSNV